MRHSASDLVMSCFKTNHEGKFEFAKWLESMAIKNLPEWSLPAREEQNYLPKWSKA